MNYEEMLLGQCIRDQRILASLHITDSHFSSPKTKRLFRDLNELVSKGLDLDIVKIFDYDEQIDSAWLSTLDTNTPSTANWEWYEGKVVEAYKKRLLHQLNLFLADEPSLQDGIDEMERTLDMLTAEGDADRVVHRKDLIPQFQEELEVRLAKSGTLPGIPSGYPSLDALTLGYQKGMYYVIGARPSKGKTAFGLNVFDNITIRQNIPAGWVDVENSYRQILTRSISSESGVNGRDIRTAKLSKMGMDSIAGVLRTVHDAPGWVYCSPNQRVERIIAVIRAMVRQQGVQIVIIDYLQKIEAPGQTKTDKVMAASTALKAAAVQLDIPIVALAQLGREADDKKPDMGMIQWASQVEQDADSIILINPCGQKEVEFIVAKEREGETGEAYLEFDKDRVRFTEIPNNV